MAALAVELGSSWRDVPPPVVAGCARAGVPVVAFHRPVRFIEITEAVHGAVVNAQFALLARGEEIHRRFTELILQGRGVPEIMSELCAAIGNPVVLEDAGGSLVYYVSGPPGDDLALSRLGRRAPRHRRGRASRSTSGCSTPRGGGCWRSRSTSRLDDFDRVAVERAALAVAIDLLAKQHDEQLRARSRGAFLSELADGRVEEADARRRAEALGLSAAGRGDLLPVVASWRAPGFARGRRADGITWTRLSGDLRSALSSTGFAVLLGPARRRPADPARARLARLRRVAARARRRPVPRRARPPRARARGRGAGDRRPGRRVGRGRAGAAAGAALGGRGDGAPGRPLARRAPPRRRRPPARPARFAASSTRSSTSSSARCWPTGRRARGRCWRRSRRTWRRAAARRRRRARCTSSASRCTCACAGSRRCSASRWTTRTSCSACTWRSARAGSARMSASASLTVRRARRR